MSVGNSNVSGKPKLQQEAAPQEVAEGLGQLAAQLQKMIPQAVKEGDSFDKTERAIWAKVLQMGHQAMQLFLHLQGDGDLGEEVATDSEQTLKRSPEKQVTKLRSVFGEHEFEQFTYSPGKNKRIELRPISARVALPENRWSHLLQEFSQLFCVESAFHQAADNLGTVLGGRFSADTLEQTNQKMGRQAGAFLDDLPQPEPDSEGKLLVASADCKGVPLVKADAEKVAAFETAKKRPGNRRMATVTSVYSIDPHPRTAEQVVDALFREDPEEASGDRKKRERRQRPQPQNKNTTARFPTVAEDGEAEVRISGIHEGTAWLADQVETRRRPGQVLVVLMDGQQSLWDTMATHVDFNRRTVGILDFLHVAVYVWEAAGLLCNKRQERERFTRERLLRLLRGEVAGVIRGLRRMGTQRGLRGKARRDLDRICGYFEKHAERMRYDVYLRRGYPIASGVIEGACRHLVKDRMERSGMRWTLEGARSMLNLRAAFQSDHWDAFLETRRAAQLAAAHPNRHLVNDYTPLTLAC